MNQGFGGKVALRLPKSLHRQAAQLAARDGVSLNQFLVSAIAERVGAEGFCSHVLNRFASQMATTVQSIMGPPTTYFKMFSLQGKQTVIMPQDWLSTLSQSVGNREVVEVPNA